MNTEALFERLKELLEEAVKMPFSNGKAIIDALEASELISEIEASLPIEIEKAKQIVEDRRDIIETAKREAVVMIKNAEEKAKFHVSREEVVIKAKTQSKEILIAAESQANDKIRDATERANELLADAKKRSTELLNDTNQRLGELKETANNYVEGSLASAHESLATALDEIKKAEQNFKRVRM